jgi:ATP-dependent Lon protease
MHTQIKFSVMLLAGMLGFVVNQTVHAEKLYKWVDEKGNTYFSDQVPPDQSQHRRESLNKRGIVIGVTERAKTKSEEALDRLLQALKEAQEKVIAQQMYHDKALRITYTKLEDLQNTFDAKLQELETEQKLTISNLKRLDNQLETLQRQAATNERNGEKVPQKLIDEIKATEKESQQTYVKISQHIEKKNKVVDQFNADIARYKQLTQTAEQKRMEQKKYEARAANELGVYVCDSEVKCEKAWKIAGDFISKHSTSSNNPEPEIKSGRLIMGRTPDTDNDLSLAISKVDLGDRKQKLFLDIKCRDSSIGIELCASKKVQDIRVAFREYLETSLMD